MADSCFAISLRQPWAALLVHGLKPIEVRRWSTDRRGPVLIHASRVADPRPEAWQDLPAECAETAQYRGGIVGAAELTDCIAYRTAGAFARDEGKHWNRPNWFRKPVVYGFVFSQCRCLPFRPYPGWVRFFRVDPAEPVQSHRPPPPTLFR